MGETVSLGHLSAEYSSSPALTAYLARPDGDGPSPGVVLIHEAFGLDDQARGHADRLAAMGYLVIAPDLFSRGRGVMCVAATFRALTAGAGPAFDDIAAARAHVAGLADCTGTVGVIGFCMGGGFALLLANRGYAASAVNYGMLPEDPREALSRPCPVVASYGGKDAGLKGSSEKLDRWLDHLEVPHDVKEYPEAGHSFLNTAPSGPWFLRPLLRLSGVGPEPESAADAWGRIGAFFAEHLR